MCVYMYVRDDDGVKVKIARPPTKKGCRGQEKLAAFRFFFPKGRGGRGEEGGGGLTWKEVERARLFSCEHRPSANLCNVVVDLFREIRRTRFLRNLFGVVRVWNV